MSILVIPMYLSVCLSIIYLSNLSIIYLSKLSIYSLSLSLLSISLILTQGYDFHCF